MTEDEVSLLFSELQKDKPIDLIWLIGSTTGLRISDILKLKYKQLLQTSVSLKEQKTGKRRRIYIRVIIRKTAKLYAQNGIINLNIAFNDFDRRKVWRHIKKAAKKCGINKNIGTHSMRKTYAVEYLAEHNIYELQKRLNHNIISDSINYTLPNDFFKSKKKRQKKKGRKT